jgi:hypothetical protein
VIKKGKSKKEGKRTKKERGDPVENKKEREAPLGTHQQTHDQIARDYVQGDKYSGRM